MPEDVVDMVVAERRLGKRGERQYVIGVPVFWVNHNGLRKGSRIKISVSSDGKELHLKKSDGI